MEHMFLAEHASNYEIKQEEIQWNSLLQRLGINAADEYEQIVINYLTSGIIDTEKLDRLIQGYVISFDERESQERTKKFFNDYHWNPSLDNESLIKAASEFLDKEIKFIDAATITYMSDVVEGLDDGVLARKLIDKWIKNLEERADTIVLSEDSLEDFVNRRIHPAILEKLKSLKEKKYPSLTLIDAVNRIIKNNSWERLKKPHFLSQPLWSMSK